MAEAAGLPMRRRWLAPFDAAVVVLAMLLSGAASLWAGQDLNFDLLSYHYYNGYALLGGRLDRDLAAVGWHTYINPTLDGLFYAGIASLPPRVFGFALGALQGANVALVYLLALALARVPAGRHRTARLLALVASAVAAIGPSARSLLGTTMGNNLVSLPVLGAVLLLCWPRADNGWDASWSAARLVGAAALCGVATGLRLTAAGEHLALLTVTVAFAAWGRPVGRAVWTAGWLLLGSAAGVAVTAGYWCIQMALRFGNPLFPFANSIFRSPWFAPRFLRDERFAAHGLLDALRPPVDLALGRTDRLLEIGARDARLLVLFVVAAAALVAVLVRRRTGRGGFGPSPGAFLLAFWFAAYGLWSVAFYYYRYMTTLELLAPVALLVALRPLAPARSLVPLAVALAVLLGLYTRSDSWGRGDWQESGIL